MKTTQFLTVALLASSAALSANDDGDKILIAFSKPYVSLGLALAHGHAHDLTQKTWGGPGAYAAEFGIHFDLPNTNVQLRPNLGVARILGDSPTETNPNIYDLQGVYIGFDVVYSPFEHLPLSLTTGPSFHTWNVVKLNANAPAMGEMGMKLGWRLGTTYSINKKFSVTLDYALTEWRISGSGTQVVSGFHPSRPTYFTLKGNYRF
ncbi:MAG: hypothetical protein LBC63_02945 [Holophagales bacterium]|jgi:hypothetical protein|nr:hypothetical protein [Holophagales bacterium]